MRIALLCPYSWTYPGGVTRHIEALAGELIAAGEEVRVLAPFDPDDALSRRLHGGVRPEARQAPAHLVPLGRTLGIEANGAVSNLSLFPEAVARMRAELRDGGYDVLHVHEPVVPIVAWDALCSTRGVPLVGTFHTYSDSAVSNGMARLAGAARRMNRLHARIAVSEAAAWTARRFFGGRYRVVPNGVHLPAVMAEQARDAAWGRGLLALAPAAEEGRVGAGSGPLAIRGGEEPVGAAHADADAGARARPLRILFIGQAVERKGLPVLLKAFEALREHVPATLTLVGAEHEQVAPLLLDSRGVSALGKVSEEQKAAALSEADVLCAPSLRGESFGMVLTEAFAASTPVIASDITGYRDVVRDGLDGRLVPPGDPVALAEALRDLALDPRRRDEMAIAARERAQRFAWPRVASEVLEVYEQAIAVATPATRTRRAAVRLGLAPADLRERVPPQRLGSLEARPRRAPARRALGVCVRLALIAIAVGVVGLALSKLHGLGVARVLASIVSSQPGLVAAGLGLMCASMALRGLAWHAILGTVSVSRRARRRDALQGTFIGVLMSATLPVRLGETSRALVLARRLGRVRETLPLVLPTIVSQTLLNALALTVLGVGSIASVDLLRRGGVLLALTPPALLLVVLLWPALIAQAPPGEQRGRMRRLTDAVGLVLRRIKDGFSLFSHPRAAARATLAQLSAWGLQVLACWLLLIALGLDLRTGFGAAAAVLFAVNVTAFVPLTPANVGVFQAACVAVLTGAYHVPGPDALAYGMILQAVELAAAVSMGLPALMSEGLSWRQLRLRTIHAAPVRLGPLPAAAAREAADARLSS